MIQLEGGISLRRPEPDDVPALYTQKNDPDVSAHLGGFSRGYAVSDIRDWVETRRTHPDDLVWVIADSSSNACLGHAGLYRIDHRVRSAELAIMIGAKDRWGRGIGTSVTTAVLGYGFHWLNLNRIQLTVLATNSRAMRLYESVGFRREGVLRESQYQDGCYVSVVLMSVLRSEFPDDR